MPLDAQHGWDRAKMITAEEILAALRTEFTLLARPGRARRRAGRDLAGRRPRDRDGPARVGVIGSVTRPFCGDCDRTRLTADGQVRNCLFASEESDLRGALRGGADDEELARRWRAAMWGKQRRARHRRPVVPAARPPDVGDRRLSMEVDRPLLRRRPRGRRCDRGAHPGRPHPRRLIGVADRAARRAPRPGPEGGQLPGRRGRLARRSRRSPSARPSTSCRRSPEAERGGWSSSSGSCC